MIGDLHLFTALCVVSGKEIQLVLLAESYEGARTKIEETFPNSVLHIRQIMSLPDVISISPTVDYRTHKDYENGPM